MNKPRLNFSLVAVLALTALSLRAEDWVRYVGQPESTLSIDGTSTIHDWTVETSAVGGTMELETSTDADLKNLKVKPKVAVSIPVRSLKSGKKPMDAVMYDAMNQKDHPKIEYKLIDMKSMGGTASGPGYNFDATGALTIAGVTKTNTMAIRIERVDKTKLKVTGNTTVKMTDFGIKPPAPSIGLGLIKTGDEVKLKFTWVTAQPENK